MSLADTRFDQLFPVLNPAQVETARRFASGAARRFAPGRACLRRGRAQRAGLAGARRRARDHAPRRPAPADPRSSCSPRASFPARSASSPAAAPWPPRKPGPKAALALPFDAAHIRALVIGSAELGEIVMRAFILRRVGADPGGRRRLAADRPSRFARICCGSKASCRATAIPTRCSTPPPTRRRARRSNASACSRTNCR